MARPAVAPERIQPSARAGRALGCLERRSPVYQAYIFSNGPGAEFLVSETQGRAPGPAVGTPQRVRIRTAKPVRSSPRLLLGAAYGKGGRSSPPGSGELGIVPGSFTGGRYLGVRTLFPSPPSQSQPFWVAGQKQPGALRSSTLELPRFGMLPIFVYIVFFRCLFSSRSPLEEGRPLRRVVLHGVGACSRGLPHQACSSSALPGACAGVYSVL